MKSLSVYVYGSDNDKMFENNIYYYSNSEYFCITRSNIDNFESNEIEIMPNLSHVVCFLVGVLENNDRVLITSENDKENLYLEIDNDKLLNIADNYINDSLYIYHNYPDLDILIEDIKK